MPTSTVTVSSTIDSHMRSADSAAARRVTSSIGFSSGETFPADEDVNEGDEHLTPSDEKRYKYRDSAWVLDEDSDLKALTVTLVASTDPSTDRLADFLAAQATGAKYIRLGPGVFRIKTVNSPSTGTKAAGAAGWGIASGVRVSGYGPGVTTIQIESGGSFGTGAGIYPEDMETATVAYGAASDVIISNLSIEAASGSESSPSAGNLVNIVHASQWTLHHVWFGTSYYHALEVDESQDIQLYHCRFEGNHSYATSGSHIQLDNGDAGPRSLVPTGSGVSRFLCEDCFFGGRSGDTSPRDIDPKHTNIALRDIIFRRCQFTGRNLTGAAVIGFDAATALTSLDNFRVEDCMFTVMHPGSYAVHLPYQVSGPVNGFRITDTVVKCPSGAATAIFLGDGSSRNTNANQSTRRALTVSRVRVEFAADGYTIATPLSVIKIGCWDDAEITDNFINITGTFPVGSGSAGGPSELILVHNVNNLRFTGNRAVVTDRVTNASLRTAFTIWQINADDSSGTRSLVVKNNDLAVLSGSSWNAATYINRSLSAVPAGSLTDVQGNTGYGVTALTVGGVLGVGSPTPHASTHAAGGADPVILTTEVHAAGDTLTASECYGGGVHYLTTANTIVLPSVAAGMSIEFIATTTNVAVIDPAGSEVIRLNGTALTGGFAIKSSGAAGDIVKLSYYAAGVWYAATDNWVTNGS